MLVAIDSQYVLFVKQRRIHFSVTLLIKYTTYQPKIERLLFFVPCTPLFVQLANMFTFPGNYD